MSSAPRRSARQQELAVAAAARVQANADAEAAERARARAAAARQAAAAEAAHARAEELAAEAAADPLQNVIHRTRSQSINITADPNYIPYGNLSPPDFVLTELYHDGFLLHSQLANVNANKVVGDIIGDCNLLYGYATDERATNTVIGRPRAQGQGAVSRQFPNCPFSQTPTVYFTDDLLFRKQFGMSKQVLYNLADTIETRHLYAYVTVIESAPVPTQAAAQEHGGVAEAAAAAARLLSVPSVPLPHVLPPPRNGTTVRFIAKKPAHIYCFSDPNEHDPDPSGHKKYTHGDGPRDIVDVYGTDRPPHLSPPIFDPASTNEPYQNSNFSTVFESVPIVPDANGVLTKNLFFISDSCADLIRILSSTPYPLGGAPAGLVGGAATPEAASAPKLNMHILLSAHTLGDPMPTQDEDSPALTWPLMCRRPEYLGHGKANKKIIRYVQGDLNRIRTCNPQFLIDADVDMSLASNANTVTQRWTTDNPQPIARAISGNAPPGGHGQKPTFHNYQTSNSNLDHVAGTLRTDYHPALHGGQLRQPQSDPYIAHVQKKRLGDHGQIALARRLAVELATYFDPAPPDRPRFSTVFDDTLDRPVSSLAAPTRADISRYKIPAPGAGLDQYTKDLIRNLINQNDQAETESIIRKGTYFLTGDWPAFCYAVYNQVNSIIHVRKNPSRILVVDFNN